MAASSTHRDPRTIITPDAFEVSPDLLGMPLAPPSRRLVALIVDLIVIAVVTRVTRSFGLVLGVAAAVFFIRAGFKRTPVRGSVFGRAMRFSVGCLGFFIAAVTFVVFWASCGGVFQGDRGETEPSSLDRGVVGRFVGGIASAVVTGAFEAAETIEEAEDALNGIIDVGEEMGIEGEDLFDLLMAAVPDDASWAEEAEGLITRRLGRDTADSPDLAETTTAEVEVASYTIDQAFDTYAALLAGDSGAEGNGALRSALESRLAGVVAADTLAALVTRIDDLEDTDRDRRRDLADSEAALTDATSGGFFNWLRNVADDLTFGFGWLTLYWTVLLSWWKGQTVGKKFVGIRVVRLDGEAITWWTAFERVGGYAAGFATGLLGFAQVYWDANRQAIHDRIVGTVVVLDGAEKVTDWESAL